jgi:hypothetical protein
MKKTLKNLCRLGEYSSLILLLCVLLLLFLLVFQRWLSAFLILYLVLLVLFGLIGLARIIRGLLRKSCWKINAPPKGQGSYFPPSKEIYVPPHTYKRPDPLIYSQSYLMSQGLAVTWNNPDIQLFDAQNTSKAVSSHELEAGKTYLIQANVWNGSTEAAAVNLLVRFYYMGFGIGTLKKYIGQTLVTVPVKGAAGGGLPALAKHDWTTPETAGHYCIQVELVWDDDANPLNNRGQENVNVKKLNSPNATFQFTLRNDAVFARRFRLRADSYSLPSKPPCYERLPSSGGLWQRDERDPFAPHRPQRHPLPEGWQIVYTPNEIISLAAGEEQIVTVKVTAPDEFAGRQAINVNAFDDKDQFVGGVTFYAHS